jgi:antitoxin VapB
MVERIDDELGTKVPFCYHSTMALNIKDGETIRLADEVAMLAGETKTRAVRTALEERRRRLAHGTGSALERRRRLADLLEREIWPQIPARELGKAVSREDREAILGYGPEGV